MSAAAASPGEGAFRFRTVAILLAVGVVGFLGSLVLSAYSPGLRSGHNGGAHALSNAAVGYSGLVQLLGATGQQVSVSRDEARFAGEDLLVVTPESGSVEVGKALARTAPTLIVFPKWLTTGDPEHSGWVRIAGIDDASDGEAVLNPAHKLLIGHHSTRGEPLMAAAELPAAVRFLAPRPLQVIRAQTPVTTTGSDGEERTDRLEPLITDTGGNVVLGRFANSALYVLADPDLLSNHGLKDERQAAAAVALIGWLARDTPQVSFDVTLNGLGRGKNPLRLAFEPPGLAMTLSLFAALLLAGWHAFGRFGAPVPPERALAFGKAALVDNTAALVRKAGRQGGLGGRYAAVVRDRALAAFGVSARVRGAGVDEALDRLAGRRRFTDLAAAATEARDPREVLAAARALHEWQGRIG